MEVIFVENCFWTENRRGVKDYELLLKIIRLFIATFTQFTRYLSRFFQKPKLQRWPKRFHILAAHTLRHFFVGPKGHNNSRLPT